MFLGKWNKSVILTYIGMSFAIFGIYLVFYDKNILHALSCLIVAGVCDLFDGMIARRCKRTEEEKKFGIQLDSLVDSISFLALPIAIFLKIGMVRWYHLLILICFAVCGIARLAYFNILSEEGSVKYYRGLPVTYTALIFPFVYLLSFLLDKNLFLGINTVAVLTVSLLNILDIKVVKPKGVAYIFFALLAVMMLVLFLGVL